ncbi:hypothetical protein MA16_Dca027305 [Dendrobium catenatum]|uniref:Uncharacterized protein n=1 Tax=Dendrobium catenatum TaxID=906689 RepID=A0A2I0V715_9ASPA|nr:hypothetical protein MA16_Dca027305 [Dendrobium catenatum]
MAMEVRRTVVGTGGRKDCSQQEIGIETNLVSLGSYSGDVQFDCNDPPRRLFASKFSKKKLSVNPNRPRHPDESEEQRSGPQVIPLPPPPRSQQQSPSEQGQGQLDPPTIVPLPFVGYFPAPSMSPHFPSLDQTYAASFYPYYPPPSSQTADIIGGRQRGRVYGLGSQGYAYEGSSPTSAFYDPSRAEETEEYSLLRESQATVGEGSSVGLAEYSDYCTWQQAVGGMQHGRVYELGSKAYAYEGQTSSGSNFSSSTHDSLHTQQIAALTAELEQIRKAQTDWHMQMQQQQMHIKK